MQSLRLGSKDLIREINESIVIAQIRTRPLCSRTDIAERTGLSPPTVSGITAQLLNLGLIEERETGESTGGRRPVLLALRPGAGFAVGIKLTERQVIAVLTDLDANVVARQVVDMPGTDVATATSAMITAVDALSPAAGSRPIHGVGVGLAGVIDRDAGTVRHATYSNWVDVDLSTMLSSQLGLPVIVDNDVNALVASEQWFGAGRGVAHFAVVSIGRGIGLGLVLDGHLYRGARGGAGEFGHMKVADGPACACGGRGCVEALASDVAICAEVSTILGRTVDVEQAIETGRSGDRRVMRVFSHAGAVLGTATANLVNLLNPELIVLAGEGTRARELFMPSFQSALEAAVFDGLQQGLHIVVDEWEDEAWARGAASLLLGEMFQPKLRHTDADRPSLTTRSLSR